jgi:hypothetical protein
MARPPDYFDKARSFASALMIAAGAAAIIGAFLEWVTIEPPPILPESEVVRAQPYTGVEAGDGWWVIVFAALLIAAAIALAALRSRTFARLAFLASIALGAIAIADVRAVGDFRSAISEKTNIVGEPDPAIGILLVAFAAVLAFFAAVTALAASPQGVEETD